MATKTRKRTNNTRLLNDSSECDSECEYVPVKDVKRIFASAKINMDILKKSAIQSGTENKIKEDVIKKMKTTITVYKNRYEQTNAELNVLKNKRSHNNTVITGADLFLKDQTLVVSDEIDREYNKIRKEKMKEYEQYFVE